MEEKKMITDKAECLRYINGAFAGDIDLDIISEALKCDPEIIEQTITKNQNLINKFSNLFIDSNYSKTMRNLFDRFGSELLTRISPELKDNGKFMAKVVEAYPDGYYYIKGELSNDIAFKRECEIRLENVAKQFEAAGDKNYSEYVLEMKNKFKQDNINIAENIYGLNKEKYELLKYYPGTLEKLSNIGKSKQRELFKACLNHINSKNLNLTEWTYGFNNLLDRFNDKNYEELLFSVDVKNIDIEQLSKILEQPNYFNIKNAEDVERYQEIKEEVCDAIVNEDQKKVSQYPLIAEMKSEDKLKFAVLQKLMGYDIEEAENIQYKYRCIDELTVEDNNDIRSWINSIREICKIKDPSLLKKLYGLKPVPTRAQDIRILEQEIKKLYMREYNKTLFNPLNANIMSDEQKRQILPEGIEMNKYKIIDAGTDFNMIMTSVGSFIGKLDKDFAKDWNKDITSSTGFSCSYIGNDMIATAPIHNICYGFSSMEDDSLCLAGDCDIYSCHLADPLHNNELYLPKDRFLAYTTPENLKVETTEVNAETTGYNELVFSREQNGKRKQPDYLIVFKIGKQIKGLDESFQAVEDFRKEGIELPIVIVDVERCLENEMQQIETMLAEAEKSNSLEKAEEAIRKCRANKKTVAFVSRECRYNDKVDANNYKTTFQKILTKTYDLSSKIYGMTKKMFNSVVSEEIYRTSYEETSVEERKMETSKIVQLQRSIMAEKYKNEGDKGNER